MKRLILKALALILLGAPFSLLAQTSTQGKDFIISFGDVATGSAVSFLQIATTEATTVSFKYNNNSGLNNTVTIPAGTLQSFNLSSTTGPNPIRPNIEAATTVSNRTLELHTDKDVSVYVLNASSNSGDATVVLPYTALGTEYYHASYPLATGNVYDAFIVAAIENGTTVYRNGTLVGNLAAGQCIRYQFAKNADGTGAHITSNNPIAFFISNHEALIPPGNNSKSMLMEQQMPVNRWGRAFLVPIASQPSLDRDEKIRVIASQPGTNIEYWRHSSPTSTTVSIASAGGYIDIPTGGTADSTFWIQANNPIGVYTYLHSVPAISQIPPVQQSVSSTVIAPFNTTGTPLTLTGHYAIVVTPTVTRDQTRYAQGAGTEMSLNGWITGANGGGYSYTTLQLNQTSSYLFKNNYGVIVWVYGLGQNESYYYVAGAATRELSDRFFLDSIGDINGQTLCFDKMIEITADLMMPLKPQPGHLKWYLNGVEELAFRDSFSWTLPFLPNGNHNITLEALDVFDSIHVLSATFTQACPETLAVPDTVSVISCKTSTIDVLANDSLGMCSFGTIEVILQNAQSAKGGSAYINSDKNLIYTPPSNFTGLDSIEYALFCSDTLYAKVYILVMECPDNIIDDAKCFGDPPAIDFGIKELARSANEVSILTSPVVGDIDGDGETEILVMNHTGSVTGSNTNAIHIYGFNKLTQSLYLKYSIPVLAHGYYPCSPIAIAKVDNNPFASIFYASFSDRTLYKYDFNGSSWTQSWATVYTTNTEYAVVAPVIADMMGNGRTQVAILDKIIDTKYGNIIANGNLLPSSGRSTTYSFGWFGHGVGSGYESSPVVIDIDGDGIQEVIGGDCVYGINIVNFDNLVPGNTFTLKRRASKVGHAEVGDGGTAVADMDNDGQLEVIVAGPEGNNLSAANSMLYVYNPRTGAVIHSNAVKNIPRTLSVGSVFGPSRPFVGDLDNDGLPEIALTGVYVLRSYKYNPATQLLDQFWELPTTDSSGSTTLTLFDFAHDGINRLVYRDEKQLRIIDGSVTPLPVTDAFFNNVESPTVNEFPVVADINGDGAAEIIVTGVDNAAPASSWVFRGELRVYASNGQPWAPARSVWNQAAYNSVNVREDLTIPSAPISPATVFPGEDGLLGTPDDVRPFNGFLMQQTQLNVNGEPLWLLPNPASDPSLVTTTVSGDDVIITVGVVNKGESTLILPVYVAVYKESNPQTFGPADLIAVGVEYASIPPGDTVTVTITIPSIDITSKFPMANIVIRLNDDGMVFPYSSECDTLSNEITIPNPLRHLMMKKDATLYITPPGSIAHNGFYSNPVSALFGDTLEYRISAYNGYTTTKNIFIYDTLPPWLDYVNFSSSPTPYWWTYIPGAPDFNEFEWMETVASGDSVIITFRATLAEGVSASQPLFANRAWVKVGDDEIIPTNYTYHQGAGVSYVTFSAGFGGHIFNATEQALDYRTSPRSGIVIVPDEGYRFTGWSHTDYLSMRGEIIKAQSGVMRYETVTVYGNMDLHANFEPEPYPIEYHLYESINAQDNPSTYTIESETITLSAPVKANDVFIGWTGSNGEDPQPTVIIPKGSTGGRVYHANFVHSGRRIDLQPERPEADKIWAADNELIVSATMSGSIVRIYSMDGVLQKQQILIQTGETKIKLPSGMYAVSLNNGIGQIVHIK